MARLYLCDDDENYRALLRVVFAGGEHEIVGEASDGRELLDHAGSSDAEIVLLDLNMPRMSGIEALPCLRTVMPDAKIIVLTSATAADEQQRVMSLGADGFIQKPMSALTLERELNDALAAA
jgi:DNA-binding NarL/FixJ family response regulator